MKTVKAKLKNHWEKNYLREKDSKKIKNEIVKKNEEFRAPRFRHSYDSNKKENEMREKEYQLKPFTNALSQALDRYILECLNCESTRTKTRWKRGRKDHRSSGQLLHREVSRGGGGRVDWKVSVRRFVRGV